MSAVNAALRFIYVGDYDDDKYDLKEYEKEEDASPILFNVYVHAIAVRLEMDDLEALAVENFAARAELIWWSRGFAGAVEEIYTVRSESRAALKEKVLEVCRRNWNQLFGVGVRVHDDPRFGYVKLNSLLCEIPAFRHDLMAISSAPIGDARYKCVSCNKTFAKRKMSIFEEHESWCPYYGANGTMPTCEEDASSQAEDDMKWIQVKKRK